MVRFILDEHSSPRIAQIAGKLGIDVIAVSGSVIEGHDDETVLRYAVSRGRLLVTYDLADFSVLYGDLIRDGVEVPGIVFVDGGSFPTSALGALARALAALARRIDSGDVDPVGGIFLTRGRA